MTTYYFKILFRSFYPYKTFSEWYRCIYRSPLLLSITLELKDT